MSSASRKGGAEAAEATFTEAQIIEFKEAFKLFDKVRRAKPAFCRPPPLS